MPFDRIDSRYPRSYSYTYSYTYTPTPTPKPTPADPPTITNLSPTSPAKDIIGALRTFNITIDQPADVSWYINGILVQSNGSVSEARYIHYSSAVGTWNVSVIATNANGSVSHTWTWNVMYSFSGFLSPIRTDGSNIFKLGSIVPIKFQLCDANGNYVKTAVVRLNITKIISTTTGTYFEPYLNEHETTGDVFIFSNTSNMYKHNLATKNMSSATWLIRVDIDDGNSNTVIISLKS